ncbi:transcription factor bHLH93 [Sesamum indicum]|uniref:Transcription factor bHLH93 n=1 Tax=Sesamum indicum TaxID=4182 RepID=A0A6I9SUT1_SESIN|nr:transcription factor bHLH93 [Sesamum indicum]
MEYYTNENGFLEELLGVRETEEYNYYTNEDSINGWSLDCFPTNAFAIPTTTATTNACCFQDLYAHHHDHHLQPLDCSAYAPSTFADELFAVDGAQTLPFCQEDYYYSMSILDNEDIGALFQNLDGSTRAPCKVEPEPEPAPAPEMLPGTFSMGFCPAKNKVKKGGQPSKNLMAERRRRKRLNDRLSMLRSVVPKISKMDRTSILGDTIDYMKELLDRIHNLQEEMDLGSNQLSIFKDAKPNEILVRNSPKFEVERRERETRIEISCGAKPGLLLSTVTTLEALGLEIEHCVISCFNDFSLHASCSEELKKRGILETEDIKQALFRNAGYGGRCL